MFHEQVTFEVIPSKALSGGELNIVMQSLGMVLYYDVYALPCPERGEPWQSETIANIDTIIGGEVADARDGCEKMLVSYPLATLSSSYVGRFIDTLFALAGAVSGRVERSEAKIDREAARLIIGDCISELLEEWGEEPGSKELRILIESSRK
ncbi:MAG: hypothetical protein R3F15_13585 [Lysobacterales bacterium]